MPAVHRDRFSITGFVTFTTQGRIKVRFILEQAMKTQRLRSRYSSTLSLTSALVVVGGQRHTPAVLPSWKTRYPMYTRWSGLQSCSGRVRKISPHWDSIPGRPPRSESLCRLSYTGPHPRINNKKKLKMNPTQIISIGALVTINNTLYIIRCTLYTVLNILYAIHYKQYPIYCTLYTIHSTPFTLHNKL